MPVPPDSALRTGKMGVHLNWIRKARLGMKQAGQEWVGMRKESRTWGNCKGCRLWWS